MPLPLFAGYIVAATKFLPKVLSPSPKLEAGPIATRNGRAAALPFLRFTPRVDFLQEGQSSLEAGIQVVNDVRRWPRDVGEPSLLEEDQETQRLSFLYSRGFKGGVEGSVEVPLIFRNGGFMDPIIDWWHRALLGDQGRVRDQLPRGRSFVRLPGSGDFGSAGGLGDVSLFLRKKLTPRLNAGIAVKVPTGDDAKLLGSGAFDAGLNFEYRTMLGRKFQLDASLGLVAQGNSPRLGYTRGLVHQESLAITYRRNSRDSWIAQWQSESAPIQTGISQADATQRMLTFGYARRVSERERLELYFSEDRDLIPGADPVVSVAPDWTVGIRWVTRFK